MCDYSLKHLKSRDAEKNERLTTYNFGSSCGFVGADPEVAVCIRPGTCVAFDKPVEAKVGGPYTGKIETFGQVGWFKQINLDQPMTHHDAIEFDTGDVVLLHSLSLGQTATVMFIPDKSVDPTQVESQERLPVIA